MTVILFCDGAPDTAQAALLEQLGQFDKRFVSLLIQRQDVPSKGKTIPDGNDRIAGLFGAQPGTLYLLRPDLHIAGRWKTIIASEILQTASLCLGRPMS